MIGLLSNITAFLVPVIIYLVYPDSTCRNNFIGISLFLATVYLVANIISFRCNVYNQIEDIEKIEESRNNKTIYEGQRDELISQVTLYLGEKYPEHEKELFRLIAEKNSEAVVTLLGAFPEIKSADVLKKLVSDVQKLHGYVYGQDIKIEKLKRQIRVRKRNPYILRCFLPTYEG